MKTLKWFFLVTFVIGIFVVINLNWQSNKVRSDDSIFTEQNCNFPCWNGLIPGETTLETAREKLKTIPFVVDAQWGAGEGEQSGKRLHIGWMNFSDNSGGNVSFENEVLRTIHVNPSIDFTLQDILTRYGEPDAWTMDHSFGGPESVYSHLTITLYYVNRGLIAKFFIYQGQLTNRFTFMPEANLEEFWLVPVSNSFDQMLIDRWGYTRSDASRIVDRDFSTTWPCINIEIGDNRPDFKRFYEAFLQSYCADPC